MSILVQEKVQQAVDILNELDIDAWMTFVRETPAGGDPVLPLIYGHDLTAQTALILTRSGERTVILGQFEAETARRTGAYPTVISYNQSIRPALLETLEKINPAKIAVNYSKSDVLADGLDHGLYLTLLDILDGTPWQNRLVSAERVIGAVRGRKTEEEIKRIRAAVETTRQIFVRTFDHVQPGMTEKQIAKLMHTQLRDFRVTAAWEYQNCPTVNAGPDSPVGHVGPGDLPLQRGHILHIDFGVRQDHYCSDIQRVAYYLKPGETQPPDAVKRGFSTVVRAIQVAVKAMKPGVPGKKLMRLPGGSSPMLVIRSICMAPGTSSDAWLTMAPVCSARNGTDTATCQITR